MKVFKNIQVLLLVMALFLSSFTTLFIEPSVSAVASDVTTVKVEGKIYHSYEQKLLKLVNKERAKRGRSKLKMDNKLNNLATKRAKEISVYYSHQRPNNKRGLDIYPWRHFVGENIGVNFNTPKQALKKWMNSPRHKKNILNKKYKSVGIGCFCTNNTFYWVQYFVDNRVKKSCKQKADCKGTYEINIKKKNITPFQKRTEIDFNNTKAKTLTYYQWSTSINGKDFITALKPECITFEAEDSDIVTVDSNGKVVPKKNGNTTVTAHVKGAEDSKIVWHINVSL